MSETLKNLVKAFIGESQARNRYERFAKIAKKEGYEQIAGIFIETAMNEREHASTLWKFIQELKGDLNEIKVEADASIRFGNTAENLKSAIAGERYETSEMYPSFAKKALEEGFKKISDRLNAIAKAEAHHAERYSKILKEVEAGTVFKKDSEVFWVCRECGYIHYGKEPPKECPSCGHPESYFQVKAEVY